MRIRKALWALGMACHFGVAAWAAPAPAPSASAPAASGVQPAIRALTVVLDDSFPPYVMRDAAGQLQGYLPDRWRLWQAHSGIAVELRGMDWALAQQAMSEGRADVIDTITRTPAREALYDFSAPYAEMKVMLFFRAHLSGITDAASVRGFLVGVKDGDRCIDHLAAAGATQLQRYPSYEALARAALRQEVAVFCMNEQPAGYLLSQAGIRDSFMHTAPMYTSQFRWAVRKGDAITLQRVADGFARLDGTAQEKLWRKWFGDPIQGPPPAYLAYVGYGLLGLTGAMLLLLAWLGSLRRSVRIKTAELTERIKEQRCLYAVMEATEDLDRPLDEVMAEVVALLPVAWLHADVAVARIEWDGQHWDAGDFAGAVARQATDLVLAQERRGQVAVGYLAPRPNEAEGPFLQEKRDLIDTVARRLNSYFLRREAAQRLHESEERFRILFEDTRQALTLIADGRFIAANRASLEMLRMQHLDELIGSTPADVSPPEQPDGQRSDVAAEDRVRSAFAQGVIEFEWLHRRADGEVFPARVLATAIRQGGQDLLHVVWSDISEQKRNEQELALYRQDLEHRVAERTAELAQMAQTLRAADEEKQAIFDAATVGILLVRQRQIVRCNRTLEQMYGYASGEMAGCSTRILYASDAAFDEVGERLRQGLAAQGVYREELEVARRDGSPFWIRMVIRAIDPADPDKDATGTIEDISLERASLAEMVHARALAEEAAQAKADFLANMSHEIRTPMNAIIGMTHLALKADPSPRQRDYLLKIRQSGQHLLGVINEILDFSKIEAGKLAVERVDFDLDQVLDGVASLTAEKAAAKGLELVIHVAEDVPAHLVGDPLRIGQVLINYANNAVKFTEQGEVSIRVEVQERCDDGLLLRFSVRDTGIGIDEAQRDRLFQSFQQADSSITRKYGGTGLGLVIAQRLAALMGGEVGVESTPGLGAHFWFTARVGEGKVRAPRWQPRPDLRGRRMLVVDDNDSAREVITDMLRGMGFRVGSVASGSAALSELARASHDGEAYDVVLLDWKMPGMDGIETAQAIQRLALQRSPRVLMITAFGRDELGQSAGLSGVEDILTKPVTASQLFETVLRVLDADLSIPLPAATSGPPAAAAANGRGGAPVARAAAPLTGRRALLVEDNELNQEVALELLRETGLEVDLAPDGAKALAQVQRRPYDVVLMDMQMPVMDGLTATREIRRLPGMAALPIIAMTANAMSSDRQRCLDAGMNEHIAKPIDPQLLAKLLHHWVPPASHGGASGAAPVPAPPAAGEAGDPGMSLAGIEGFDAALGLRQSLGREALYRHLLATFVQGQAGVPIRIAAACSAGDWPTAERLAHTLKGVAAQVGATAVRGVAERLERALHVHAPMEELAPLQAELAGALAPLLQALQQRLQREPTATAAETAVGPVDPVAWTALRARLLEALETGDPHSLALFDEHGAQLRAVLGSSFERVAAAVRSFDFQAALDDLRQMP